ncbi:uncharacterized protein LODBEIA_P13840 [Lodderomyces beijingensis]|uniref:Transcription elongation factor Eaf N-terminal domain-containing protein n=1 Tax=Lodderomyces beijingensis TaxID=1775926 RepID=A0ABP0ZIY0_9ASCO
MSLADGEYDIDLSILLNDEPAAAGSADHIAIRYGFMPSSVDQTKPLKLYKRNTQCILEASSSSSSDPNKSVLFEGIPHTYRREISNNSEFYLTYRGEGNTIRLEQLNSTIRFNKSRNPEKLEKQMQSISNGSNGSTRKLEERKIAPMASERASKPQTSPLRREPKPVALNPKIGKEKTKEDKKANVKNVIAENLQLPSSSSSSSTVAARKVASKRPPANTPEPNEAKEPIISESDFEDLDEKGLEFPDIKFDDEGEEDDDVIVVDKPMKSESSDNEIKVVKPTNTTKQKETKPTAKESDALSIESKPKPKPKPRAKTEPKKKKEAKPASNKRTMADHAAMEMDDDFKDLEDQLQEVLGNEEDEQLSENAAPPSSFNQDFRADSGSEADDSDFETVRIQHIKINEGTSTPRSNSNTFGSFSSATNGKPRSLRDWMGGGKSHDDGSSSEEE